MCPAKGRRKYGVTEELHGTWRTGRLPHQHKWWLGKGQYHVLTFSESRAWLSYSIQAEKPTYDGLSTVFSWLDAPHVSRLLRLNDHIPVTSDQLTKLMTEALKNGSSRMKLGKLPLQESDHVKFPTENVQ